MLWFDNAWLLALSLGTEVTRTSLAKKKSASPISVGWRTSPQPQFLASALWAHQLGGVGATAIAVRLQHRWIPGLYGSTSFFPRRHSKSISFFIFGYLKLGTQNAPAF